MTDLHPVQRTFCSTREAAALLGVSVGTVQQWVENGLLEAWKTAGGHRRVMRDSVDRLLRRRGTVDQPPAPEAAPQRPTVMAVDDDINLLRLYEARISRWPMSPQVICVNNAVLALLRIGRSSPDLLLLDLNMPGMDGFNMLHTLRHAPEIRGTTVAVVTGLDAGAIEARGGLPGDIEVFSKPINFEGLLALWNSMVGQGRFSDTTRYSNF
ncbi:Response regulatory domain-containing protein [Rubrivivax sp. A210]|uniref:excisionase family DNA-binding protein n=1 Tax=Rubrivivax sp. A210 TaxID=2772301 RepID=UPI0019A71BE8|nr:excisionase family DNA-binding protein [Rubrivivax sp. A210]CAD5373354.1 Response regulatory domain-containing protein [Rubrivivax sp. A210]